jgi:hypothetical protein
VVTLKDREEFAGEQKGQVDQILLLINALLVLSVLIAVLGIVNTLAMSVLERTRENRPAPRRGPDPRQLRRMVRLESVLISVYGSALGLGLGGLLGISLTRALSDRASPSWWSPADGWRCSSPSAPSSACWPPSGRPGGQHGCRCWTPSRPRERLAPQGRPRRAPCGVSAGQRDARTTRVPAPERCRPSALRRRAVHVPA